jgi:protein phosphatase
MAAGSLPPTVGAHTDAAGRSDNEDACAVLSVGPFEIVIVADGAGGHAAGEVASAEVISASTRYFEETDILRKPLEEVLTGVLHRAHRAVRDKMKTDRRLRDMRTTALFVIGSGEEAWVAHVGDTRAYLVRGGHAERLTRDDSLVQSLIDLGQLDEDAAKKHSKANVLTQSIGDPKVLEYHVKGPIEVKPGDRIVACSDGLWESISDAEIAEIASSGEPAAVAEKLVGAAIGANASDNVTVAVMVWNQEGARPMTAKHRVGPSAQSAARKRSRPRKQTSDFLVLLALALVIAGAAIVRWRRDQARVHAMPERSSPR